MTVLHLDKADDLEDAKPLSTWARFTRRRASAEPVSTPSEEKKKRAAGGM